MDTRTIVRAIERAELEDWNEDAYLTQVQADLHIAQNGAE